MLFTILFTSMGLKMLIKKIVVEILRLFFSIFYHKKYLSGRFFENTMGGWVWAFRSLFTQKLFGYNRHIPFPVSPFISISNPNNIEFHPDDINNFQSFGIYFQNLDAKIRIGRHTYIAPNVGIITTNHDSSDPTKHLPGKDVAIGQNCWIGMNSVLLPGTQLGNNVIVGAGSIVTKSFLEKGSVIAGNPARIIKKVL